MFRAQTAADTTKKLSGNLQISIKNVIREAHVPWISWNKKKGQLIQMIGQSRGQDRESRN